MRRKGIQLEEELACAHGVVLIAVQIVEDALGYSRTVGIGIGHGSDIAKLGESELAVAIKVDFVKALNPASLDGLANGGFGCFSLLV